MLPLIIFLLLLPAMLPTIRCCYALPLYAPLPLDCCAAAAMLRADVIDGHDAVPPLMLSDFALIA